MQVRKGIYFKLKNFDRPAEEQKSVFSIAHFPRGSGLTGFAGRPFTRGRSGAGEKWIKAVPQGFSIYLPLGQLLGNFEDFLSQACLF